MAAMWPCGCTHTLQALPVSETPRAASPLLPLAFLPALTECLALTSSLHLGQFLAPVWFLAEPGFGTTLRAPIEAEMHLYNENTNVSLAHEVFIRYLSNILKVGLKQHMISHEVSSLPDARKNFGDSWDDLPRFLLWPATG